MLKILDSLELCEEVDHLVDSFFGNLVLLDDTDGCQSMSDCISFFRIQTQVLQSLKVSVSTLNPNDILD